MRWTEAVSGRAGRRKDTHEYDDRSADPGGFRAARGRAAARLRFSQRPRESPAGTGPTDAGRRTHGVRAGPRPDRALAGVPALEAQDAGLRSVRGGSFSNATDSHDRGLADRAQRGTVAQPERGP